MSELVRVDRSYQVLLGSAKASKDRSAVVRVGHCLPGRSEAGQFSYLIPVGQGLMTATARQIAGYANPTVVPGVQGDG